MSTEVARQVLGVGERGEVALITFDDNEISNGALHLKKRYVVRMGAFTMQETGNKRDAERTAQALVR